ncbi:hypothetical protein PR048_021512 [Dryococelus australis]|uniref:Uncharacterized protein n=1 Tax=Dryococelus australis TaxID=614101 RepID=A0ABQ9GYG9_9NEOP|nr:hypothetical protein PR048_021512 [Dryococelus australis]
MESLLRRRSGGVRYTNLDYFQVCLIDIPIRIEKILLSGPKNNGLQIYAHNTRYVITGSKKLKFIIDPKNITPSFISG